MKTTVGAEFSLPTICMSLLLSVIALAVGAPGVFGAVRYTVTDLGRGEAHAINDNGQVVGESDTAETTVGERHAFLYIDGKMTDLGTLLGPGIKSGA